MMGAIKAVLKRRIAKAALALGLAALLVGPAGCVVIVPRSVCVEEERVEVERKVRVPLVVPCEPVEKPEVVVPVCTPQVICPTEVPQVVCPTEVPQIIRPTEVAPTVCPTQVALTKAPVATATAHASATPEVLPQTGRRPRIGQ